MELVGVDINIGNLDRGKLIKLLLILELFKYGGDIYFSDRELDILTLLYIRGGVSNKEDIKLFIEECYKLGYTRTISEQSIRNVFTKARSISFVKRPTSNSWKVIIIPELPDIFYIKSLISNYAINK